MRDNTLTSMTDQSDLATSREGILRNSIASHRDLMSARFRCRLFLEKRICSAIRAESGMLPSSDMTSQMRTEYVSHIRGLTNASENARHTRYGHLVSKATKFCPYPLEPTFNDVLKIASVFCKIGLNWAAAIWAYAKVGKREEVHPAERVQNNTSDTLPRHISTNGRVILLVTSMPSRYSSTSRAMNPS